MRLTECILQRTCTCRTLFKIISDYFLTEYSMIVICTEKLYVLCEVGIAISHIYMNFRLQMINATIKIRVFK